MKYFSIIGRSLFALPLFIFGLNNIFFIEKAKLSVPQYLPSPEYWAYGVAVALILSSIGFIVNKFQPVTGILTAVLLFSLAGMVHFPGLLHPQTMQSSLIGFLKDLAMGGAALFIGFNSKSEKE
jgi:putative oxidoreductase